ncbi:hypothetical protein SLEP1_g14121 [Rubroshorea leprosula]|uniref:Mechanosensitive ion channel protein n=1 Tax=Rubroshorea leprosula TaxID=152421 RepID=A0AAV5INY4_9ROSI|nr:hypothetical protein SLEP1_g14121 [Rubroshorea leprosula]
MAEKKGEKQHDDLETGNTEADSSSMNTDEISVVTNSTPNDPRPKSVDKENTTRSENSNSKGRRGEGIGSSATSTTSKSSGCLVFLLVVLGLFVVLLAPLCSLIAIACLIVTAIAAPKRWTIWVLLEWIALIGITGLLIASLTSHSLKNHLIWELEFWKCCILLMVVVCGELISEWIVNAVFLLICFLFAGNLNAYCFVYGLKRNRVFVWCGLVLIAWLVLVICFGNREGTRSVETKMILNYVTRALASLSVGAGLWLGKDLLLSYIVISFHGKNSFEKILKVMFNKFVIETLDHSSPWSVRVRLIRRYGFFNWADEINKGKQVDERKESVFAINLFIDCVSGDSNYKFTPKLKNAKQVATRISNKVLQRALDEQKSGRSSDTQITDNRALDEQKSGRSSDTQITENRDEPHKRAAQSSDPKGDNCWKKALQYFLSRITIFERLRNAGQDFLHGFPNLRRTRKGEDGKAVASQVSDTGSGGDGEITKDAISSFFKSGENLPFEPSTARINDEVDMLFQLIDGNAAGGSDPKVITKMNLEKWIEAAYEECKSLESSLHDTRRKMADLNTLFKGIVIVLIVILWLLMMKVLSTQAVALILSQLFVLAFVFGDTCKKIFEGIIFVFVIHPFDVNDRCLIEDRQEEMVVKEINIQTTVFSRVCAVDSEVLEAKIVYPNSVLATKSICSFHSSRRDDEDHIEFVVDAWPCKNKVEQLEKEIKMYAEERSWKIKNFSILANGFDDGDKIKMGVYLTYEHNEDDNERRKRKSGIILFLKQNLKDTLTLDAAAIPPADV